MPHLPKVLKKDLTGLRSRIKFIREIHKISKSEFARRLEISGAYVTGLESGKKPIISARLARVVQDEFGVSRKWLLEGKGEPFLPERNRQRSDRETGDKDTEVRTAAVSEFERLLSEISATYINLSIEGMESVLRNDFRRLTQALGFDSCILFTSDESPGVFQRARPFVWFIDESKECNRLMIEWLKTDILIEAKRFPYSFEMWNQGKPVPWVKFDDCPKAARGEMLHSKELGIKSALSVPISFAGFVTGIISVATVPVRRTWPDELVSRLRLLGEVFVNALMRKKSEEKLQNILLFNRFLSEVSAKYINLPLGEFEKVLKEDFVLLSSTLGVDNCILYETTGNQGVIHTAKPCVWVLDEYDQSNRLLGDWLSRNPCIDDKDFTYMFSKWNKGEHFQWTGLAGKPNEPETDISFFLNMGVKSALSVPIFFNGSITGILGICTTRSHRNWPDDLIPRLRLFGEVFVNALMRKRSENKLHAALSEISRLKERFESDYLYLKEEIKGGQDFEGVVGKSEVLNKILLKAKQVAPTSTTVLILGETGTGKGLIARVIHDASRYRERPLIQVNCAALAPSLIESELFGHEKGAFTGATARRCGRFEAAKNTTLFLDEIGDLPLELQPKLLRVLEDGEFERVGGSSTIHTNVRLIAATSRDLEKEVDAGRFRRELLYRLNIFPIYVPPLRERLDDIPLFVEYFVDQYEKWMGKKFQGISAETVKDLQRYSWPGNIRELKNVIERAVITSPSGNLSIEVPSSSGKMTGVGEGLRQIVESIEHKNILKALEDCNWIIGGPNGAAQRLNLPPSTLRYQVKKLVIRRTIS